MLPLPLPAGIIFAALFYLLLINLLLVWIALILKTTNTLLRTQINHLLALQITLNNVDTSVATMKHTSQTYGFNAFMQQYPGLGLSNRGY